MNSVLNPSKPEDYDPTLTEADIFNCLGITEEEYYNALSTSSDSDYELHLKRPLDRCFINNVYLVAGINARSMQGICCQCGHTTSLKPL